MDEAFELLTLMQTGKAQPAPVVLLDTPGGNYWSGWLEFVRRELLADGYISPRDLSLLTVTDGVDAAVDELTGFFSNYDSQRFVDGRLVVRLQRAPDGATLAGLSEEFADIVRRGRIERVDASPAEREDDDALDRERIAFWFDRRDWARLGELIDRLNGRAG